MQQHCGGRIGVVAADRGIVTCAVVSDWGFKWGAQRVRSLTFSRDTMLFTLLTKQTVPRKTSLMTTAEAAKIGSISATGFNDPLAPLKDKESGDQANRTIDFFTVRRFSARRCVRINSLCLIADGIDLLYGF